MDDLLRKELAKLDGILEVTPKLLVAVDRDVTVREVLRQMDLVDKEDDTSLLGVLEALLPEINES